MQKTRQLVIHSSPLALGVLLSYLFWELNILLLGIYAGTVLFLILIGKDRRVEGWIFIYGMVMGSVIEVIGTQVSGYQNFTNPDILGVPYWIIVAWGYGFILMKRIALIISTNSPWIKK